MSNTPSSLPRLFAELKRRKVFRVMAVYGVIGFGVIEAAGEIFPRVGIPDWAITLVVWLVLLGFPIAVVLAWAFESTPDGMKRTLDAAPEEISEILAQPGSRRWMPGLLAFAGMALLFGGWWMGRVGTPGAELNLAVSQAQAAEFRTIAVLPFENVGGNEEDRVLVSGLHMDLQAQLVRLSELRVTSPMSVREYESSNKGIREIADELNVDHILRGSVRRSANQVRVDVQLIDARTNENMWVAQFDREVTAENLFAIQSDIARQVADQLEAEFSREHVQRLEAGPSTDNLAAWNSYHLARTSWNFNGDAAQAIVYAERAVELAPEFIEAWAFLARLKSLLTVIRGLPPSNALVVVERTEALAPGSFEAKKARAWYTYYVNDDFDRALELFLEAAAEAPSDVDILKGIAWVQHRLGEFAEGTRTMKRAAALDPQNAGTLADLSSMLGRLARWKAAAEVADRALQIDASNPRAQSRMLLMTANADRDVRRALSVAAELELDLMDESVVFTLSTLAIRDRDYDAAARALAKWPPEEEPLREMVRLWWRERVEQLSGGDPTAVRDSLFKLYQKDLKPLFDSASHQVRYYREHAAVVLLLTDEEEAGWRMLDESVEEYRTSKDQVGGVGELWWAALVYARFGRSNDAIAILEDVVARPTSQTWALADLEFDPRFDALRGDPRFDALMARQEAYEAQAALDAEAEGPWVP